MAQTPPGEGPGLVSPHVQYETGHSAWRVPCAKELEVGQVGTLVWAAAPNPNSDRNVSVVWVIASDPNPNHNRNPNWTLVWATALPARLIPEVCFDGIREPANA